MGSPAEEEVAAGVRQDSRSFRKSEKRPSMTPWMGDLVAPEQQEELWLWVRLREGMDQGGEEDREGKQDGWSRWRAFPSGERLALRLMARRGSLREKLRVLVPELETHRRALGVATSLSFPTAESLEEADLWDWGEG